MSHERILVTTDLSEHSAAALRYGAMLRDRLAAQLTVLFVDEPGYPVNMPELPLAVNERPPAEQALVLSMVRRHVEPLVPPPLPEIRTAFGFAASVILKTAEAIQATLLVMGTRGRKGLPRLVTGSVTESVLSESSCPVVTLGPAALRTADRIRTILCPVNFSFVALDAMRRAARIASDMDAELVVLYVAEEKKPPLTEALARELSGWIEPHLRDSVRYREMVATGNAAERVLEIADQLDAGLLVIGAQRRIFRDTTVIGGTSERIVRFARCAVLTVPRAAD